MIKGLKIEQNNKFTNISDFINYANTWTNILYLTGSRYFNNHKENSDWDFFCYGNEIFINFLVSNGFYELDEKNEMFQSDYVETGMKIFEIQLGDGKFVHIQVYTDEREIINKQNAQIFLSLKTNIRQVTDKQERKRMWTLILTMIDTDYGQKAVARKLKIY